MYPQNALASVISFPKDVGNHQILCTNFGPHDLFYFPETVVWSPPQPKDVRNSRICYRSRQIVELHKSYKIRIVT